jgi:hypothetical protein
VVVMTTLISPYKITAGEPFCAAIRPRDRRTRRSVSVESPRAAMRPVGTTGFGAFPISASVRTDRSVQLDLTGDQTTDIPPGEYELEVVAVVRGVSTVTGYGTTGDPIVTGYGGPYSTAAVPALIAKTTVTVEHPDRVTPLTGAQDMLITYAQLTDYKTNFSWLDANGNPITAKDGWFRAEDSTGVVVVDIGWFASIPDEVTIAALPADQRGYVAVYDGGIQLHFSDKLVVAPGTYQFDMLVQSAVDDGWDKLASGTLVVERTIA